MAKEHEPLRRHGTRSSWWRSAGNAEEESAALNAEPIRIILNPRICIFHTPSPTEGFPNEAVLHVCGVVLHGGCHLLGFTSTLLHFSCGDGECHENSISIKY